MEILPLPCGPAREKVRRKEDEVRGGARTSFERIGGSPLLRGEEERVAQS